MGIGQRIKEARNELGMTQSELARRIGVTPQTVQQWERGVDPLTPRPKRLERLAQVLKKSPEWFIARRESPGVGIHLPQEPTSPDVQTIAQQAMNLSPAQRKVLLRFLEAVETLSNEGKGS